jgi:hypothetical protein
MHSEHEEHSQRTTGDILKEVAIDAFHEWHAEVSQSNPKWLLNLNVVSSGLSDESKHVILQAMFDSFGGGFFSGYVEGCAAGMNAMNREVLRRKG